MEPIEMAILFVVAALAVKTLVIDNIPALHAELSKEIASIMPSQSNWKIYAVILVLSLPLLLYWNYRINRAFHERAQHKQLEKEQAKELTDRIGKLIYTEIDNLSSERLNQLMQEIKEEKDLIENSRKMTNLLPDLDRKISNIKAELKVAERREELSEMYDKADELKNNISSLIREKLKLEEEQRVDKSQILQDLEIDDNPVFRKEDLLDKEVAVLLDSGYTQANEYCPFERRLVQVLVNPVSNHSKTHTFLVWSVMQILEEYSGVTNIKEHRSKDADLTFSYGGKVYALEIETGTLLGKNIQIKEKLKYLSRKYPKRWMFVVSNKNLLSDYRKLGFSTPRNRVYENLQKLLKSPTQ